MKKGMKLGPCPPNHAREFLNILPMALSVGQVSWQNDLKFKRYILKRILSRVLILIVGSQPSKIRAN